MNYSSYRISLDNHATSSQVVLNAKQGDTGRKIYISLTEGSTPYQIEDGCRAVFTAEKPDTNLIYNDCVIENNVIIYTITAQTTAAAGFVACEIKLYDANDILLISPRFGILVEESVFNDQDIATSGHEFNAVRDIIVDTVNTYLENNPVATDATLTQTGMAADAKATGDAIALAASMASQAQSAADSAAEAASDAHEAARNAQSTADHALPISGGVMTGPLGVQTPTEDSHAVNKKYVDDMIPTLDALTDSVLEKFTTWEGGSY